MAKIYMVYSADAWLSSKSKELKGIFESKEMAINAIINAIKKYSIKEKSDMISRYWEDDENEDDFDSVFQDLLEELKDTLEEYNQIQGFETCYMIEVGELNDWWK